MFQSPCGYELQPQILCCCTLAPYIWCRGLFFPGNNGLKSAISAMFSARTSVFRPCFRLQKQEVRTAGYNFIDIIAYFLESVNNFGSP